MKELMDLEIMAEEYDLFWMLTNSEKIEFLFDALSIGVSESMLKQLYKPKSESGISVKPATSEDLSIGPHRLCLTSFDNFITLNSDNLRVMRLFVRKFFRDGYILLRTNEIKKDKDFDLYKYFKAYKIFKIGLPLSENWYLFT